MVRERASTAASPLVLAGGLFAGALAIAGAETRPLLPLLFLAAAGLVALAILRPLAAVYLAVLLIPLESVSARFEGGAFGLSPTEAVALVAAAGCVAHRLCRVGGSLRSPLTLPLLLLLLAHVPGLFLAADRFAVVKELVMWTAFFVIFLAVVANRGPTSQQLAVVIASSAGMVAAIAVAKTGGKSQIVSDVGGFVSGRATGSFAAPTLLGVFLAILLSLQLMFLVRGPTAWHRVGGLGAAVLSLLALALAMTRSAFLAVAVVTAWLLLVWRPFRRIGLPAAALAALILFSGVNPLSGVVDTRVLRDRLASAGSTETTSAQLRLDLWKATPKMIEDNLPWGVGADNFVRQAPKYGAIGPGALPYTHAHNVPLTVAAEFGLPGLAALAWIAIALTRLCARAMRSEDDADRALGVALSASFLAITVDGIFDYAFSDNAFFFTVILLGALAVRAGRGEIVRAPEPATTERKPHLVPA